MTNAKLLIRKGKRAAAAIVQEECISYAQGMNKGDEATSTSLTVLLDHLLNPETKAIDDQDTIDWCTWLVGGGRPYDEFANQVRELDTTPMCGLVWTADFVAYRCRTCGISTCMSLCAECFRMGNHEGHDFNQFKSQAGGACDCGDTSVMKESGFCSRHHGVNAKRKREKHQDESQTKDLTCVAEFLIPRLIQRLVQHLRANYVHSADRARSQEELPSGLSPARVLEHHLAAVDSATRFLQLLSDFSLLGSVMRSVFTRAFMDERAYAKLIEEQSSSDNSYRSGPSCYWDALRNNPKPQPPPEEFGGLRVLSTELEHRTFLEELVFWMVKYEFPEKLVCFLLNILPDPDFKRAFTRCFVLHYSRMSQMLVHSPDTDKLTSRVVHVSVQLFSNKDISLAMTEDLNLLHIMVASLKNMLVAVLVPSEMNQNQDDLQGHMVVNCSKRVMRNHIYWPLVSDFNNLLCHPPIAFTFMRDDLLLRSWFHLLSFFQGMNLNVRVVGQHIEVESNTYMASFSAELEAAATSMWALVSHLKDHQQDTKIATETVLQHSLNSLSAWLDAIGFKHDEHGRSPRVPLDRFSFHLPLHRHFAMFLKQALQAQGFDLDNVVSTDQLERIVQHPLSVQVALNEIGCGLWVRNGMQINGQVITYVQCHFCKSMLDADLFLMQVGAVKLPVHSFLDNIMERFQVKYWLSLANGENNRPAKTRIFRDQEQELRMLESFLTFLVSLLSVRTNLGLDEEVLTRLEMVSMLCMGDRTHSMLYDNMPIKGGGFIPLELFGKVLNQVAEYSKPRFEASGSMQQGMYLPKANVWEELFDPIYALLRAVYMREFQTAIQRFNEFAKSKFKDDPERLKSVASPWPPFRLPPPVDTGFKDPRVILQSRYAHGLIFNLLHICVHGSLVNDFITSLSVHLLELALTFPQKGYASANSGKELAVYSKQWLMSSEPIDLKYDTWFPSDSLPANLRHTVPLIFSSSKKASEVEEEQEGDVVQAMEVDEVWEESDDSDDLAHNFRPSMALENKTGNESYNWQMANVDLDTSNSALGDEAMAQLAIYSPQSSMEMGEASTMPLEERSTSNTLSSDPTRRTTNRRMRRKAMSVINESIISLMLKLHSKYSNKPDSYVPLSKRREEKLRSTTKEYRESRLGDACFFIEKALDRISEVDEACAQAIEASRLTIWPSYHRQEAEKGEEEERLLIEAKKRRVKERQRKMMEELAAQRRRFMTENEIHPKAGSSGNSASKQSTSHDDATMGSDDGPPSGNTNMKQSVREYTCCHCLVHSAASEDRPIGLVTLIQPTSVLAHAEPSSSSPAKLTTAETSTPVSSETKLGQTQEWLFHEMKRGFSEPSVLLSSNRSWIGGIHVQSCGHYIHHDCRQSYCETLKQMRMSREHALDTESGEFTCPLCRQMSNGLLPVPPDPPARSAAQYFPSARIQRIKIVAEKIHALFGEAAFYLTPGPTQLRTEMSHFMAFLIKNSLPQCRLDQTDYPAHAAKMFVTSVARTNLEADLVQRGGHLRVEHHADNDTEPVAGPSTAPPPAAPVSKTRHCFAPLMHVLAIHTNAVSTRALMLEEWGALTSQWSHNSNKLAVLPSTTQENSVPLLMHDPLALMLHFILMLPVNIEREYLDVVIQACFNLQVIQTLLRLAVELPCSSRSQLLQQLDRKEGINPINHYIAVITRHLLHSGLFEYRPHHEEESTSKHPPSLEALNTRAKEYTLHYLRLATLVKHYLFNIDLPLIKGKGDEWKALAGFLNLLDDTGARKKTTIVSACDAMQWFDDDPLNRVDLWCCELNTKLNKHLGLTRHYFRVNMVWNQPRLLVMPKKYDDIFQFYHKRKCVNCQRVPKDPSVCLVCGTMVCLKQFCCRSATDTGAYLFEATRHSLECGGGTAIFLAINSSSIVVIRGKRACVWGSVYLDAFGEEDKDLKRGKPLYLHEERYQLLERQWLAHKFEHISRKWVIHSNGI